MQALDGVSLQADRGTLTALVGPDGAGKTTLIRLACGLMTADTGELKVLDIDVAADPQQVQSRRQYAERVDAQNSAYVLLSGSRFTVHGLV